MSHPDIRFVFTNPVHLLAFGFGSGLSPKAPGTLGTAAAIPFWFLLAGLPPMVLLPLLGFFFLIGIFICGRTSSDLKVHDHGGIVWDEFVGLWVTLAFVGTSWLHLLLGFIAFRFFDIAKPWPIKWLDKRVHGGFGIMIDDLVAGLMAGLLLKLIFTLV